MSKDQTQLVFEALQELNHTDITYLLGDLCAFRGWDPEVKLGETETPGDIVVHQILPLAKSVALTYVDQGRVSGDQVQSYIDSLSVENLTIIVDNQPREEAVTIASDNDIALIGLGDVAKEITLLSATEVLLSYLPEDGAIATEFKDEVSNSTVPNTNSHAQEEKEGQSLTKNISLRTLDDSFTENMVMGLKFTGAKYYETPDELENGYILSLEAASKGLAIKYWGKELSVQDTNGFTHEAMSKSDELKEVDKENVLSSQWTISGSSTWSASIPRGGKIKTLAMVQCEPNSRFYTWSYEHSSWSIEEDDDVIEEAVSTDEFKIEGKFEPWPVLLDTGLPDEVEEGLRSLGYQAIDTKGLR